MGQSKEKQKDPMRLKLKEARTEIEAVLKKHDIGGFVTLHAPGFSEVFWNIWPSYSILKGDFPSIRMVSKLTDYGGDTHKQQQSQQATCNMIHHLSMSMGQCSMQFLELASMMDAKFGSEHTGEEFEPARSPLEPGLQ